MENNIESWKGMKKTIALFLALFTSFVMSVSAFNPFNYLVDVYWDEETGTWCTIYDLADATLDDVLGTEDDGENGVQKSIFASGKMSTLQTTLKSQSAFDLEINDVTELLNFATQVSAGNTYEG